MYMGIFIVMPYRGTTGPDEIYANPSHETNQESDHRNQAYAQENTHYQEERQRSGIKKGPGIDSGAS